MSLRDKVVKHLEGQHDQKSHDPKRGKRLAATAGVPKRSPKPKGDKRAAANSYHGSHRSILERLMGQGLQSPASQSDTAFKDAVSSYRAELGMSAKAAVARAKSVFVTTNLDDAREYGTKADGLGLVLKITPPANAKFRQDELWSDTPSRQRFEGDIPTSWISGVASVGADGQLSGFVPLEKALRLWKTAGVYYAAVVSETS